MSLLAATQIPKPSDEQAFERASIVLWRGLLNDLNVRRNRRRRQRQSGLDLYGGGRNVDPSYHVGMQCKLKGPGQVLTEDEVRDEVKKVLTFRRLRFVEIVDTELTSLHECNFASYRIRPSEFVAWRQVWEER